MAGWHARTLRFGVSILFTLQVAHRGLLERPAEYGSHVASCKVFT
jgi:hypothetical protein